MYKKKVFGMHNMNKAAFHIELVAKNDDTARGTFDRVLEAFAGVRLKGPYF